VLYAHIDEGKVISFRKKGSGMTNTEYTAFEFKDRPEIPEEILDAAVCLDELLHIPTYEEVAEAGDLLEAHEAKKTSHEVRKEPEKAPEKETKAPVQKEPEVSDADECPYGAAFGNDFGQYEECDSCAAAHPCKGKLEKQKLEAAKKKEVAAPAAPTRKLLRRG